MENSFRKAKEQKLLSKTKVEYDKLREGFLNKQTAKNLISYKEAKVNKVKIDWNSFESNTPNFLGIKNIEVDIKALRNYIDWTPFFITWEMHGKYPAILKDEIVGVEAVKLFNDANELLNKIEQEDWLAPQATFSINEASAEGDDVTLANGTRLNFLRQQSKKSSSQPNFSLADFICPQSENKKDYIGAFAVTIKGIEPHIKAFEDTHDDYNKIMLQAIADRLAEACAEYLHKEVRTNYWGYSKNEKLQNEDLIREKYQGIRPAPGYPACPDHTEKYKLFELLGGEENTGITMTESLAMYPASSVSGWYFSHPESKYFGIGKIKEDQIEDYAMRKEESTDYIKKWLGQNLA